MCIEKKGLLFDLDGVLVDTAKYHYRAWKEIADELAVAFTPEQNERLKGVSRRESFEILLQIGKRSMEEAEKVRYCEKKNRIYQSYIANLNQEEVLPGVREFLKEAKEEGYRIALGSASKNAVFILEKLQLLSCFDEVIDGTKVTKVKPDPEVFQKGAQALGLSCKDCIVFEDSAAGIEAAHRAGMKAVGIGSRINLPEADAVTAGFQNFPVKALSGLFTPPIT